MDGLLTAVKTVKQNAEPSLTTVQSNSEINSSAKPTLDLDDELAPNQIIDLLRSRPSREELTAALTILDPYSKSRKLNHDIRVPGPDTTQILQVLVSTTVPDHWALLSDERRYRDVKLSSTLLRCFSSVPGLGALVSQLRLLVASARNSPQQAEGSRNHSIIRDLLAVIAALLEPSDFLFRLRKDIEALYKNQARQHIAWNELVSLVASGKIISVAAEAITCLSASSTDPSISWISEGRHYAPWLGRNISLFISRLDASDEAGWISVASLTERSLSLGYSSYLVPDIYLPVLSDESFSSGFRSFLSHLRKSAQLTFLQLIFVDLPVKHPSIRAFDYPADQSKGTDLVSSVAAFCSFIIGERAELKEQIAEWLSKGQFAATFPTAIYRGILTLFDTDALQSLLMRTLENFGDKFTINHNSDRDHDANAQVILLTASRLHRLDLSRVKEAGRSRAYLNAVSNRLASSSNRARYMGMVVGTGISSLVDETANAMKFDLEEMKSEETGWYLSLTKVFDEIGSFKSMNSLAKTDPLKPKSTSSSKEPKAASKGSRIVEIISEDEDVEEEEDDDLIPYEKPDDDLEDEEDDPTLVQRNKPTAPVYIRDLITYLRDNENVERFHLAISTAPSLIRRKTGFGSELAEQIEELALTIIGLQNENDHPQFHEARLQSMIALIVSQPQKMGRWFAAIFFEGDLSQVQRSAVLTALGISAREIAGNGEDDVKALGLPALKDTSFPSKRLSPALEAMFQDSNESPVAVLTREMSRTSLQPLAADAADAVSGPNALKVRTFSSRMEVEKRRQERDAQRQRSTAKDLYNALAEGFFYPLTSRFNIVMLQFASSSLSSYNPFTVPHILTLFLQTLSLIFSTSGPYTTFLHGLTQETLSLLLSLYTKPISNEPTVTAALLTLFLATIDLNIASGSNGEERLVTEFATQVMELREWASQTFDTTPPSSKAASTPGAPPDPREQIRTLAAGVMVRLGEITERYQGRLMGVNSGFKY